VEFCTRSIVRRWIGGREYRNYVEIGIMALIIRTAHQYDSRRHGAEAWVSQRANLYCWNFRSKLESESAWKN
jgi:hypothetical protein